MRSWKKSQSLCSNQGAIDGLKEQNKASLAAPLVAVRFSFHEHLAMQIDGTPILTRATTTAGRTLCGASLILITTDAYNIDLSGLTVLGVAIDQDDYAGPAFWLLLFTAFGYFFNWIGDVYSFRGWNQQNNRNGFGYMGEGGGKLQGEVDTAMQKYGTLSRYVQIYEDAASPGDKELAEVGVAAKEAIEVFRAVKKNAWRIGWLGWCTLYVWHGLVPLLLTGRGLHILYR